MLYPHVDHRISLACENPAAHPGSDNYTSLGEQVVVREGSKTTRSRKGKHVSEKHWSGITFQEDHGKMKMVGRKLTEMTWSSTSDWMLNCCEFSIDCVVLCVGC